ncbi:thymidine phosphorylase family protein [Frateuria edaphi]|uniref:thymidine phosphorylase family protein n=1 Tax=Frateuria edaphi TaxID=2898793 RepID=UPI001E49D162|nr:thymidine phosphorylase family protein [Frateuria edaphi]UGB47289.1 thymidine phosphorylase family protein [Frateuria edaphi]
MPAAPLPELPFSGERLRPRRIGIDTGGEHVAYLPLGSSACHGEGFGPHSRLQVSVGSRGLMATLAIVHGDALAPDEVGLSESAWLRLQPAAHEHVALAHPPSVESLSSVRAKLYGRTLADAEIRAIVMDIAAQRYSNLELATFIAACSNDHLALDEVVALTGAMVDSGARLHWPGAVIVDKHCVGGLPGNRTTPIVVAICTALGLVMPKTSSRAITSPAGTADTMAMLAPVDLDLARMRRTVERTGGCIVWGGAINLAPVDDTLIRIERALDIDSPGQLVASILSKKIAAGSNRVVIDVPVGPTAKVREPRHARTLERMLRAVAGRFGLELTVLRTDGLQPVGRGVGPALEAHDVLAVLQDRPVQPRDLRERALALAAAVIEVGGLAVGTDALALARECLDSGRAWRQFQAICEAQGGMRAPGVASYRHPVGAGRDGRVDAIDNRRLAQAAKLAGAPLSPLAGLVIDVRVGDPVTAGQPLFTLHAQSPGELAYAMEYVSRHPDIVRLGTGP